MVYPNPDQLGRTAVDIVSGIAKPGSTPSGPAKNVKGALIQSNPWVGNGKYVEEEENSNN